MGYFDQVAEGSDKNEFRLWIEGIDAGFVTSSEDIRAGVNSTTNLEPWYVGLKRDGMEFSQDADITQARIKASTMTLSIADVGGLATSVFAQNPGVIAYLTDTISDTDTSIPVTDSSLFSVGQLVYCGTETWYVSAKPDAVTLTVSRTWRGSQGVFQYVEDGERRRTPEITDVPRVFEGRRARLYCKGEGDTGWTAVFYGIIATEPRLQDLVSWEINIDPITKMLDQEVGPDEEPTSVRGIYYPYTYPLRMKIVEYIPSAPGTFNKADPIRMIGFWESQEDFCVELNSKIATAIAAGSVSCFVTVEPDEEGLIRVIVRGNGLSTMTVDVDIQAWHIADDSSWVRMTWYNDANEEKRNVDALDVLHSVIIAPTPRGWFGTSDVWGGSFDYTSSDWAAGSGIMYLGGGGHFPTDINGTAIVSDTDFDDTYLLRTIDPALRTVDLRRMPGVGVLKHGPYDGHASVRFGLNFLKINGLESGSLGDFLQSLIDMSTTYSSLGYVPFISTTDLAVSTSALAINAATSGYAALRNRVYSSTKNVRLGEILSEECKLIGCYLSINGAGQIVVKQVAALGTTDTPVTELDESNTLMSTSTPAQERNAYGLFNSVSVKTGYDWVTEKYEGATLMVRSLTDYGISRRARVLSIEPKANGEILEDDIGAIMQPWFAMFSKPYTMVTLDVPFTEFEVYIGDTVTLTSDKLPDYDTGERGWTVPKRAMVTGRKWNLDTGVGTLTLLVVGQAYAGYTPQAYVTAHTGGATVSTTTLTVNDNLPSPWNNTSFLPSGTLITDFYSVGDRVRLYRFNATSLSEVTGEVTSVTSTTIGVSLDSPWTPSAFDWIITYGYANDADLTTAQRRYSYLAEDNRIIDFDGDPQPARLIA